MSITRTRSYLTAIAVTVVVFGATTLLASTAFAAFTPGSPSSALSDTATAASGLATGDADTQIFTIIGNIVDILLGLLGIIFFLLTVWAGYIWMTAQGDPAKVTKAQKLLTEGAIGLVIIFAAYAISNFALNQLLTATTSTT